jgi:hypothetical protein
MLGTLLITLHVTHSSISIIILNTSNVPEASSHPLGPRCGNKTWPETQTPTCLPCPLSMCMGSLSSQCKVDNGGSGDCQYAHHWSQSQSSWMLLFVSSHHLNEVAVGVWTREGHDTHWSHIAHYSVTMAPYVTSPPCVLTSISPQNIWVQEIHLDLRTPWKWHR